MGDLDRAKARARSASERSRWIGSATRCLPLCAVAIVLAVARPTEVRVAALVAGLTAVALVLDVWRRAWGRAAIRGIAIGSPVAIVAGLATVCAPGLSRWECGLPCLALGLLSAFGIERLAPRTARRHRAVATVFAGVTSFIGCEAVGVGVALAAALMVTFGSVAAWALTARAPSST